MEEAKAETMEVDEAGDSVGVAGEMGEASVEEATGGAGTLETATKNLSSSSDSESDDEGNDELQIETLEKSILENPMNYEAHLQYIQILRRLGHIEKLRYARESMSKLFPLSPKMWQEWTKDEISLSSSSEAFAVTVKLYERGVHEYLSVPLWCDYLNFVQDHDQLVCQCTPAGATKMRNLFERALTAAGLHILEGKKVWEAYREYEQAILLTISDLNKEENEKQTQRIRALFHRQLSVPSVDLRTTLLDYKQWEVEQGNANDIDSELDGVPHNVASAYQKAVEMYNTRSIYEELLSDSVSSSADGLKKFTNYIKFEESCGDPARVQILYERAVSEFPISSDLWLGFTRYLDRTLKVPSILKDVYSRATRNCPWVGELWIWYMLSLERMHATEKELSDIFEQSICCVFPSFKEYLDLFLNRVDSLRRRISLLDAKDDGLDQHFLIRETFQRAVDYFSPQQVAIDDLLHVHAYWARLEANIGKDLVAARGVWESLIKKSGSVIEVWKSYITMEIEMGHINEARSIYKRCYNKRFLATGSEDICHSWLRFEREYGTLDDFDLAEKKVTPRLKELMMLKIQQESKSINIPKKETSVATNAPKKRQPTNIPDEKQPAAKKKKGPPKSAHPSYVDPTKKSRDSNDAGVVDKLSVAGSHKPSNVDASGEQQIVASSSNESKRNIYIDQCTAFVSNISLEANEEHIRKFFVDCGGATAIRLLRDKFTGKSRGFAYVDFSNDEHLLAAIAKNKQKLLGNKVSIARSDPKQSQRRVSANSIGRGAHFRSGNSDRVAPNSDTVENPISNVKLIGKNTFAAPRSVVKPLGWTNKEKKADDDTENPKSNEEFREMLLKK